LYLEVFFLLQNKHMMVEELLQFLIAEVDAQLLEPVELKINIILTKLLLIWSSQISNKCILTSKISKPAISRTPIKTTFFMESSTRVSLHFSTRYLSHHYKYLKGNSARD
jgi:hypothetical protein